LKAKTVFEALEFQRGIDSKSALDVGHGSSSQEEKREEESYYQNKLSQQVQWSTKACNWNEIREQRVTAVLEVLLEKGDVQKIPHSELFIPENDICSMEIPEKYRRNIWGVWDEDEETDYLMDCQGYDYPRYLIRLVV
jgi:hypothetical protein